ncbi:MAG TPA: cytochrome b N-terminal domain-containing protein [Chloroflexota bacterium]|nr:cytochrome b N-terminal domain-containing protein [Chloroflexota bacterium]
MPRVYRWLVRPMLRATGYFGLRPTYQWLETRTGIVSTLKPLIQHPVPRGTGWAYVFGSATLISFIMLLVTGIALATGYTPTTNDAYQSLQWLSHSAILGRQLRGIHYFAASAMFICIGLHVIRVFLTGAYKFPREVNWLSGVLLLLLTLAMGFTGQLLRWDQNGLWSAAVAAGQVSRTPFIGLGLARFIFGGETMGGQTLSRFFAFHVFWIPGALIVLITFHLFLVIRNGISEPPRSGRPVDPRTYRAWYEDLLKREGVPFWPDAMWRDVLFGGFVVAIVVTLAIFIGPPDLVAPADPTIINAEPSPDWYLLWYFAALAEIPKDAEPWVMIGGPFLVFALMFILPFAGSKGERSPLRRPWAIGIVALVTLIVVSLTIETNYSAWVPNFDAKPLPVAEIGARSGPVYRGAMLWHSMDCEYCHLIAGYGGIRGPNLTFIADRYTPQQMTIRIMNGGDNMPAYASILTPKQMSDLLAFLETRTRNNMIKGMFVVPGSGNGNPKP